MSRSQRRRVLAVAALTGLLGAGLSATPAVAAGPDASASVDVAAADLAADRGISLAEASTRMGWQGHAPDLADRAGAELGSRFGGVWIDPTDGDRVKLGLTGAMSDSARNQIRQLAASTDLTGAVDVVPVRHGFQALTEANDWIAAELERVNANAPAPLSAGIRTDRNMVEIAVPDGAVPTSEQRALIDAAHDRYGDAISVASTPGPARERACVYPFCDPPLRGGIRITNPGVACTGAFLARSRIDNVLYQFTAGHCVAGGHSGDWSTRFTDGSVHVIGPRHNSVLGSGGDMAILRVNNPAGWRARAWVFVTAGPDTSADHQYSINADGRSVVGQRICTSGAFFGRTDCGTVTQLGVSASYEGVTVRNLGRASFCGIAGDSGAPVFANHTAYGLQVAGFSQCDSLYQGIHAAEDTLNVNVAHDF